MKEIDQNEDGKLDIDEFISLMSMDPQSMSQETSKETMLKMKKVNSVNPVEFARNFKSMPAHIVKPALSRLFENGDQYPSSVFMPKLDSVHMSYEDLVPNPHWKAPVTGETNRLEKVPPILPQPALLCVEIDA